MNNVDAFLHKSIISKPRLKRPNAFEIDRSLFFERLFAKRQAARDAFSDQRYRILERYESGLRNFLVIQVDRGLIGDHPAVEHEHDILVLFALRRTVVDDQTQRSI